MKPLLLLSGLIICLISCQTEPQTVTYGEPLPIITAVDAQPLLAQAVRVSEALDFIGNPLPNAISDELKSLQSQPHDSAAIKRVQELLDPFCLAYIDINPESRVKVNQGPAQPELIQDGWKTYLLKVHNQANITAALEPESPNALPVLHGSTGAHRMKPEHAISEGEIDNQFVEMAIYKNRPMKANMSGLAVEYFLLQVYTKASGKREVKLGFNVGQGSQDIGFRNTIDLLFDIKPAVKVIFEVKDEDGSPAMASFTITDGIERIADIDEPKQTDYRHRKAQRPHWQEGQPDTMKYELPPQKQLSGIFPLPARRVADRDEYPDFFFQPQVYRGSGEHVWLPPGTYHITYGRGPEYLERYTQLTVPEGTDSLTATFELERWIHMADLDWYSADHHIHAAGCSHYESPEEGVKPEHMWRQVLGEDLNMGNNLTWGPSWYHQKQYFTAANFPLSDDANIMRYDVEVSGFPSSHAGHIVLLNLKEDDYPNTTLIEEWPSWTLPILQWAKSQGGLTGYAHSGWGLAPITPTPDFPNYVLPKMDGIGANEYVVTVTHDAVDFYSAGDTPLPAELNMWYHTLNCGFRVRLSGETDFPCISDERVGRARIYAELKEGLDFDKYMQAILDGRSYVSDGYSHLIDFSVNGQALGDQNSELKLSNGDQLNIAVKSAAYLSEKQEEIGRIIAGLSPYQSPYWHVERARLGGSREVAVELIVNGVAVEKQEITADGKWQNLNFNYTPRQSSWVAVRIYGSAHTNPVFVELDGQPIRVKESAEWCRAAVDQCWKMKEGRFKEAERDAAREAYDHARRVYEGMM